MIRIKQAVVVEGKYDKIRLSNIVDAVIIPTNGFSIYKDKDTAELIKTFAKTTGIVILTDSDSAGFKIRAFLGGSVPEDKVFHAYIPDIFGKEKRKTEYSKEGKLGVEGVPSKVIYEALERAGVVCRETDKTERRLITNVDLYEMGFSGIADCKERKEKFLRFLSLPSRLSTKSFVKVLNTFMTYDDFLLKVKEFFEKEQKQ